MTDHFDLIVRGGTCMTPAGRALTDVGVRAGRIEAVGDLAGATAHEVFDARGLFVLPGVIDAHMHAREPGATHKEDLETASRAAVLGGVTAMFDMPNTKPLTTTAETLADKVARAKGRVFCHTAFYVGAASANLSELARLERLPGCCGVKLFMGSSTGDLLVAKDADIARAFASGVRRISLHAEDEDRLCERRGETARGVAAHPDWRDAETAARATRRAIHLARAARRPIHILHLTTAEEVELIAAATDVATCEVTPQHLLLAAPECYERLGTKAQMNPPIRDERHRAALWQAVTSGLIDALGSDHAPHTLEEKAKPYPDSPSGMTGIQTLVPLMLEQVAAGRLSLERFVDLTSAGPARIYGIAQKGRLARGYDADLTLVDLGRVETITNARMASRCGWTPFDGTRVRGWPVATVVRGHVVMRDGAVAGAPVGEAVRFVGCAD